MQQYLLYKNITDATLNFAYKTDFLQQVEKGVALNLCMSDKSN